MLMWFSNRNIGLSFSNLSWQSEKISDKESCLYGIIDVKIIPFFDVWFIVSCQLSYTISSEGLFVVRKYRIYAACGVSQTPNHYYIRKVMV